MTMPRPIARRRWFRWPLRSAFTELPRPDFTLAGGIQGGIQPPPSPVQITLPSCDPYFDFQVSIAVHSQWRGPETRPPDLLPIAVEGLTRQAQEISQRRSLTEAHRLRGELDIALLAPRMIADTGVQAWAYCTGITSDPESLAVIEGRERARRQRSINEWNDSEQRSVEARMQRLITDPLRATAWWFAAHPGNHPHELHAIAEEFKKVRTALEPERSTGDTVGALVDEFSASRDEANTMHLTTKLRDLFKGFNRGDLVARLDQLSDEHR